MGASARVRALAELTIDRHVDRVVAAHVACRRGGRR
jgi:hypothetical protein